MLEAARKRPTARPGPAGRPLRPRGSPGLDSVRVSKPGFLIWRLVLADLRHEWLLSLCMILAIASIMTPLLILFGLKYGTIETFRQRLLADPRNLEIRPLTSQPYNQAWFADVKNWPEVAFVVPHTRQMSATLDAYAPAAPDAPLTLDIIPSGPGDPWLAAARLPVPNDGQAVLSASAAEALGLGPGERLKVAAKRLQGSRVERGDTELTITGVFKEGGPDNRIIFASLPFVEKIEAFKDGQAVPDLGWTGDLPVARPVFSQALIRAPGKLDPTLEFRTINNTGFAAVNPIDPSQAAALTGRTEAPAGTYYLLETRGEPARTDNLLALANLFRGVETKLYPLAGPVEISLLCGGGLQKFAVVPDSFPAAGQADYLRTALDPDLPPAQWLRLKVAPGQCPEGGQTTLKGSLGGGPEPVSASARSGGPWETTLTGDARTGGLKFPVLVEESQADLAPGQAAVPLMLLGLLDQAGRRALTYEPDRRVFLVGRRSYAGFRLYAQTLEDVAPLQKRFEGQGLKVSAESARIEEMKSLDKYLTLIFWLITTGAVIGASASLLSNIYAGLERKRRELGVLRLLGISGFNFLRFPLYSSILLATGGFLASWFLFLTLSALINHLFSGHLQVGESLCRLTGEHVLIALAMNMAIAALAGLLAARRAARIEPAEALRDE